MSVDVSTEIVINKPRDLVACFVSDPFNAPAWYVNIKSVKWKTSPPLAVGSRIEFVAHFLGKRLAYTYEIIDHVPGERLVMSTDERPFPMETSYEWRSLSENRTRMTLRNRGEPRGFGKMIGPLMPAAMRRANQKDLERLKTLLESENNT